MADRGEIAGTVPRVAWKTVDRLGRTVLLTDTRLAYVRSKPGRSILGPAEIIRVVHEFELRLPDGISASRERLCARGIGSSTWLVVVVDFSLDPAPVLTAWPARRLPSQRRPP